MRILRDEMLTIIAHVASQRGTCNRLRVGAVLAFESRPVSLGYNGAPSGEPHCDNRCNAVNPCTNTIHAEENAINWARAFGIDIKGATLYVTDSPCMKCTRKIVEAGISRVVYDRRYRIFKESFKYLTDNGVEVSTCHVMDAINAS